MAALDTSQVVKQYDYGVSDKVALFVLRGVTTGDTVDMLGEFKKVVKAVSIGTTVNGYDKMAPTAGTVLTIPTGYSNDGGWLFVYGVSA